MSATATPIPADVFAEAITELPLTTLYVKAAEISNSIAHLQRSNAEMLEFIAAEETPAKDDDASQPAQGDRDLQDAIRENQVVIARMVERVELIKAEVERRGGRWTEPGEDPHQANGSVVGNGDEGGVHL